MMRIVQSDQTFFFECIKVFRNEFKRFPTVEFDDDNLDFILTPFKIQNDWNLINCTVHPSISVELSKLHNAFISQVTVPNELKNHFGNQYCQALASILTFITLKPFKGLPRREFFAVRPIHDNV